MHSRRAFVAAMVSAPAVLGASATRTFAEVERMIARGDVRGKLSRGDLPTPSLVVEADALEDNIAKMSSYVKRQGRAFRPHAKTHKCPEIALSLIRAGATGACAAKISEAEALAAGGVTGLLLTSAMIGPHRIERAVRLARTRPETIFSVDNPQNAEDLNAAARAARLRLNVAVDLLVGRRTGIQPGQPALALAQHIATLPGLKLAGLQAYAGHASHTNGFEKRKSVSEEVMGQAVETRRLMEKSGIECRLLTGGSTGTYNIDSHIDGVTEIQPGSFVFMDTDYNRIGGQDGPVYSDFRNSLFVIATVISKPSDSVAIVDAGFKAMATDRSFAPQLRNLADVPYGWAGDEHGSLNLSKAAASVKLGDRVEIVVPHCDPTVNLYDHMFVLRGDQVEAVWKIAARGKTQ
jgi:D-serine deaminase-like pyridoxal phosphate-dependent protein